MNILVILVPVSLVLGGIWLGGFIWALKGDQFEDLEGDAQRILFDEADQPPEDTREG
ncbi:cbb3-type cytochrome oxidase assembly protein CcoS [Oceaniglobus trochenteri]|uniref:cbb3-type cytochrome oxidase assembly protein CcoS n=1 Tax=Oceaniglobus trochenteri TaxID=2763260 RepID=UPI001CFF986D|nr:cbb3-type cytochrome oxidase assembly protein CcoS [Oceaniglobus trochenteri]